ncbi:MAG: hypothetical protein IKM20_09165 [Erysipelotrichales bacterium]|nr:hypothetical protein [Erysipelotrichales bacterium]
MSDNEGLKPLIQGIRDNIGKLIGVAGDNVYVVRGTIELAIESVFRNFFTSTSRILLVGRKESLEYIEYICDLCELKHDSIYVKEDVLPLLSIMNALNNHYDALYIPYTEMNNGVLYNINVLKKTVNMNNILLIVNISNSILMNPVELDNELIDIAIGNAEIFDSMYAFIGISNKAKNLLGNNTVDYFINYASYDDYINDNERWVKEYQELYNTLLTVNQFNIIEWYSYFTYLVSFMRTKIKTMGYHVLPDTNYSNAYIVVEVSDSEAVCEELYDKHQILVYAGYKDMHKSRIIIDMKDYQSVNACLKLLKALKEIDLK